MENVEDYCIIKEVFHLLGPNIGEKSSENKTFVILYFRGGFKLNPNAL